MRKPSDAMNVTSFNHSLSGSTPLPLDTLSPESLARLRSGGTLTPAELETLRAAAAAQGSIGAKLLDAMLSSGTFDAQTVAPPTSGAPSREDPSTVLVNGPAERFEWRWDAPTSTNRGSAAVFESLLGQPQPAHDSLAGVRHALDVITTVIALAIPAILIGIGLGVRAPLQDVVVMAIGGALVGVMIKKSV